MSRIRTLVIVAAVAAVAVPMGLQAQENNAPTASQLEARAQALYTSPDQYTVAAQLFKRAAGLRAPGDPQGVESLAMAARLLTYSKQYERARSTMEAAAERALADGDVVSAAHCFADAAYIAGNYAHTNRAADLVERVVWLAATPGLSADQRQDVIQRLGPTIGEAGVLALLQR
jgi:dTDP-4-amino-4,6-dideoxygalactose transaminase